MLLWSFPYASGLLLVGARIGPERGQAGVNGEGAASGWSDKAALLDRGEATAWVAVAARSVFGVDPYGHSYTSPPLGSIQRRSISAFSFDHV